MGHNVGVDKVVEWVNSLGTSILRTGKYRRSVDSEQGSIDVLLNTKDGGFTKPLHWTSEFPIPITTAFGHSN